MEKIEAFGNKIEILEDGGFKVTTESGQVIVLDKDGNIRLTLEKIAKVGFENIVDLKSHVIMREGDLTVHQADFHDGGKVKFAFTAQGKLVEFSGHKIVYKMNKDDEIMISSHSASEREKKA